MYQVQDDHAHGDNSDQQSHSLFGWLKKDAKVLSPSRVFPLLLHVFCCFAYGANHNVSVYYLTQHFFND